MTICISEPYAGSDIRRILTSATLGADGIWRVTGEKCWISFGSHDLAERIGHCILAQTSPAPGVRGLSLFLVPDRAATGEPKGVALRRTEEKMGLHGSPTCAIGLRMSRQPCLQRRGPASNTCSA
ncbi:alkylation response protein AidB-like acyl-CoA dehydrogenase [Novosphingobium capsulatum]|uniref:Alkylation response protein AidB-like acyl-CoA dehydrogenase n=1 Tax=Novosphingobium capsulatum TaxID=13688 RepID=A0ABU1MR41_9SPHN|nr:acyl-CoA dehydrogenase family protein [Novosphingobium capsulatum]MDR6512492.1 alkylation response protein AidB-like acyl-CoA dehydrogenase [Novosphingobium capsulatum]